MGKKICNTPAEIQSFISGTQFNRLLKILQGLLIVAETAFRDSSVMPSGCKDGIYAHRTVEISFGTTEVTKIVFGDSSEEKRIIVSRIQTGEHIEILYGK